MFIRIKAEYALYLNPDHVVTIYQDHNQHWHAETSNAGDVDLTSEEARQLRGQDHAAEPGTPITAVLGPDGRDSGHTIIGDQHIPPAGPVGFGAEMQAL